MLCRTWLWCAPYPVTLLPGRVSVEPRRSMTFTQKEPAAWLDDTWARVVSAPKRRRDPWRLPVLATVGDGGKPQARTVVLRRANPATRVLEIHTDSASAKVTAPLDSPFAELCFWDAKRSMQVRMSGCVRVSELVDCQETWRDLGPRGQRIYRSEPPPGTVIQDPTELNFDGKPRFVRIECTVERLDWLHLTHPVHQRWLAQWQNNKWALNWVAP